MSYLFVLTLQRILLSCFVTSSTLMMQQDGFITEIGKMFGEALLELTDSEPDPGPFDVIARELQPDRPAVPAESDQNEHAERILRLSAALESWVILTCQLDEQQQVQVAELVAKSQDPEKNRYAKTSDPQRQNRPFGPTTPILFVQSDGDGTKFTELLLSKIRAKILNDTQRAVLDSAVTERRDFHRAAFRDYVVSIFDEELFLTSDQRQAMLELFAATPDRITSPFYSFIAQNYYLPYKPLSGILKPKQAVFLDDRQQARLKDLSLTASDGNSNYIMFQSTESPEDWAENVKQAIVKQQSVYLHAAAVRIGYMERSLQLTPDQVEFLTVASKGATVDALDQWKESTQQTIDQMQQQMAQIQGNFAFSAQNITTDGLDSNAIWIQAVKKMKADAPSKERTTAIRSARAKAAVAILDQELWLVENQRAQMQKLTETALPRQVNRRDSYDDYVREFILLAYPLHKGVEPRFMEVLSQPQQEIWKQLKEFIRMNKANNYIEIPLKNQGGSFTVSLSD